MQWANEWLKKPSAPMPGVSVPTLHLKPPSLLIFFLNLNAQRVNSLPVVTLILT